MRKLRTAAALFLIVVMSLPSGIYAEGKSTDKTVKVIINVIKTSDEGSGDKYDTKSEALKDGLKSINKKYFRHVKEYERTVTIGKADTTDLAVGKAEITVKEKTDLKYPLTLRWIKDSGSDYVKINFKDKPGKLLVAGSSSAKYDGGELVLVIKIQE